MANRVAWLGTAGSIAIGALVALAGSDGGVRAGGIPAFALCIAIAFAAQWLVFVPAWLARSERFFDLTGSATFLTVATAALLCADPPGLRTWVIAILVGIWAMRLGLFLSARIRRDGFDRRFDRLKGNFAMFLMTWTIQGLWVSVSFAPGIAAILAPTAPPDAWLVAGGLLWLAGFAIEVAADEQKRRFRRLPANAGRFIETGLWAWSRHPNYFGEILLWCGIAVAAFPALEGWQHATLLCPVLVWLQLSRVSGIPLLNAGARKRWGDDPAYRRYLERTPKLLPRQPRR